jgi:hypothetical protein
MLAYRYCKARKEGGRERYQVNPHESDTVLFLFHKEDKHAPGLHDSKYTVQVFCNWNIMRSYFMRIHHYPKSHSFMYTMWRTASLRSAPHQQTPDPVYIVVDKLVHCDPNMYS